MKSPPPPVPNHRSLRRTMIDLFIAGVLGLFVLDTMPCTPESVRRLMAPLLNITGLWQGTWSLFAPIPDSRNQRLRADIAFADGSNRVWYSPDWRTQSPWQRFVGHRHSEFLEKIWEDDNSVARSGFAQDLIRREVLRKSPEVRPERVVFSVIWNDIPPPQGAVWPLVTPADDDQERVFFTLIYPE